MHDRSGHPDSRSYSYDSEDDHRRKNYYSKRNHRMSERSMSPPTHRRKYRRDERSPSPARRRSRSSHYRRSSSRSRYCYRSHSPAFHRRRTRSLSYDRRTPERKRSGPAPPPRDDGPRNAYDCAPRFASSRRADDHSRRSSPTEPDCDHDRDHDHDYRAPRPSAARLAAPSGARAPAPARRRWSRYPSANYGNPNRMPIAPHKRRDVGSAGGRHYQEEEEGEEEEARGFRFRGAAGDGYGSRAYGGGGPFMGRHSVRR